MTPFLILLAGLALGGALGGLIVFLKCNARMIHLAAHSAKCEARCARLHKECDRAEANMQASHALNNDLIDLVDRQKQFIDRLMHGRRGASPFRN